MHRAHFLLLPCIFSLACASTPRSTDTGSPVAYDFSDEQVERAMREQREAKPVRLRCELFYRESNEVAPADTGSEPKYQHVSRVLDLGPEEDGTVSLGTVTLSAHYFDSVHQGSSFQVRVSAKEQHLHSVLYQFNRTAPPKSEFVGDHGFTGLVYVTSPYDRGGYQYICKVPSDAGR